jgi:hypothetical protein
VTYVRILSLGATDEAEIRSGSLFSALTWKDENTFSLPSWDIKRPEAPELGRVKNLGRVAGVHTACRDTLRTSAPPSEFPVPLFVALWMQAEQTPNSVSYLLQVPKRFTASRGYVRGDTHALLSLLPHRRCACIHYHTRRVWSPGKRRRARPFRLSFLSFSNQRRERSGNNPPPLDRTYGMLWYSS